MGTISSSIDACAAVRGKPSRMNDAVGDMDGFVEGLEEEDDDDDD